MTVKNPVLKNITDYLVEEGSFEEEELLGNINLSLNVVFISFYCMSL